MSKPMRRLASLLVLAIAFGTSALAGDFPDLPPTAAVRAAVHAHPRVQEAVAGTHVEAAQRDRLAAGPHEYVLRLGSQHRRDRVAALDTREHEVALERAIRLPGKAAKDAELGAAGVEQASLQLQDAVHESARLLLKTWFDWRREGVAVAEWSAQLGLLEKQHAVVARRVAAGDAARLESLLSAAQLAQAEASLAQAVSRRELAAAEFAQHFPGIVLPRELPLLAPPLDAATVDWRSRILAHNHELAVARNATRRALLLAQCLDAERQPDPTLGLLLGSERNGQERVVGLQLSIPLPGSARQAAARGGVAEADAASAREAMVVARLAADTWRTIHQAQSQRDQWQRLAVVSQRSEENLRLLEKAWQLGEGQFSELQLARRQAIDARLAASQAQLDARAAYYRLLLDAHELWEFDAPVEGGHDR